MYGVKKEAESIYEEWARGSSCSDAGKRAVEFLGKRLDVGYSPETAWKETHAAFTGRISLGYVADFIMQVHVRGEEFAKWRFADGTDRCIQ